MPTDTPEDRWELLSGAYAASRHRGWETRTKAAFFAMTLERELRQFIGAPARFRDFADTPQSKPIQFYSYTIGSAPLYDRFEPVESAMDAISPSDAGFVAFGLGVTLEVGPTTVPRSTAYWLMRINTSDPTLWICEVRAQTVQVFHLSAIDGQVDVKPVIEACFENLMRWLAATNQPQQPSQQIGFTAR